MQGYPEKPIWLLLGLHYLKMHMIRIKNYVLSDFCLIRIGNIFVGMNIFNIRIRLNRRVW